MFWTVPHFYLSCSFGRKQLALGYFSTIYKNGYYEGINYYLGGYVLSGYLKSLTDYNKIW